MKQYIRDKGQKHLFTLIIVQLLCELILCLIFILNSNTESGNQDVLKWLILLVFSISQFYYAWHSIIGKNILELFAYIYISYCTAAASYIRFIALSDLLWEQILTYVYIAYSASIQIIAIFACYGFYNAFKYDIFVKVGATISEQRKYKWQTYFKCLMEIYAQLTVLIFLTFFYTIEKYNDYELLWIIIDCAGIALTILAFILGYFSVKNFKPHLLYIYFCLIIPQAIFQNYRLVNFLIDIDFNLEELEYDNYTLATIFVIFASSIVILGFNIYYGLRTIQKQKVDSLLQQTD